METIPDHVVTEIMLRLPLRSLVTCICVSKEWASKIRGKAFKDLYLVQSMTRPRFLFIFCKPIPDHPTSYVFHSVYQEEKPLLSSGQQQLRFSSESEYAISNPVRGLVCLQSSTQFVICNPGTNKFLTLPEIGRPIVSSHCIFGYDEVTDVFKVLCTVTSESVESPWQHLVFTVRLGEESWRADEESWRPVACEHLYTLVTRSLCKGGVVYYGAWLFPDGKPIVMSFNLRSEEFTVIELPEGVKVNAPMVNYNGKIALVDSSPMEVYDSGEYKLCVRNEISGEWRVERVVIHRWRETVGNKWFTFKGTIGTGEIVFTTPPLDGSHNVLYYDTVKKNFRKFKVEAMDGGSYDYLEPFLNHFDSLLLM